MPETIRYRRPAGGGFVSHPVRRQGAAAWTSNRKTINNILLIKSGHLIKAKVKRGGKWIILEEFELDHWPRAEKWAKGVLDYTSLGKDTYSTHKKNAKKPETH